MSTSIKVGESWKTVTTPYVNINGVWKTVTQVFSNISGTWKEVWSVPVEPGQAVFTSTPGSNWTVPAGVTSVEVLVVAGGGGSGGTSNSYCYGGDAGQVVHQTGVAVTPGSGISIVVGGAGAAGGGYGGVSSTSGGNSSFGSITATGGKGSCATRYPYAVSGGQGGDGLNCNGVKADGLNVKVNGDTVFGVIFGSSYGRAACNTSPPARSPNTGDGGHGVWSSNNRAGSNGGSGIVIVRWGGYSGNYVP